MATTSINNNGQFNITPYYDDFNESKGFHRILFKPGVSVQARELTQLQTLLQAQLDRFGQYAFKEGDSVVNGEKSLNVERDYIKLENAFTSPSHNSGNEVALTSAILNTLVGTTLTGQTNGVTATVDSVEVSEGSNPHTAYLTYTGSGTGGAFKSFAVGEVLQSSASGNPLVMVGGGPNPGNNSPAQASSLANAVGQNASFNLSEGVIFLRGNFVFVPTGSITLDNAGDKYSNTPNGVVGLQVTESIVNSNSDSDLLDNALGAPNQSAPGADRYAITTTLVKAADVASINVENFVIVAEIEDGKLKTDKTDNPEVPLDRRFAKRTFEESGNYSVNTYSANVKEHLDTGSNFGYLTSSNGGDAAKVSFQIEPNIAYVKGFRVENTTTNRDVVLNKPRSASDKITFADYIQTLDIGNFMKCATTAKGVPPINDFDTLDLYDNTNGSAGSGTIRGTARARSFETVGSDIRLYLFDINMNTGHSFGSIRSVEHKNSSNVIKFVSDFKDTASQGQLFQTGSNSLVFPLPFEAVELAAVNTSYKVKKRFVGNAGTNVIATGGTPVNEGTAIGCLVTTATGVPTGQVSAATNISGGNVTFGGLSGITASQHIEAIITMSVVGASQKSKTANLNETKTGSLTNRRLSLGKSDVYKLVEVRATNSSGNIITDKFTLDTGQRDNFYDHGAVELKPGFADPGTIFVKFHCYTHGAGDYFSAESYPDYDDIGTFSGQRGTIRLRDAIDFRPRKDDAGTGFTGSGNLPSNGPPADSTTFEHDVTHYMSRIDNVFVDKNGKFDVVEGVSDTKPVAPQTPDDAMSIFTVKLDPYVFDIDDDVHPKVVENKRYTMKDIGRLDKRLKTMEYFTSLSLLEQNAADIQLKDGNNNERLKNGFIVDNFYGTNVAETSNPEYSAAMDRQRGVLRPQSINRNINLVRKTGDAVPGTRSGTHKLAKKTGSLVHLDGSGGDNEITEVNHVNQPFSSFFSNVNPYNIFSWTGMIELSPDSDEWKETDIAPKVFIDDTHAYDQFKNMAEQEGILGTVYNEWETTWTGSETQEETFLAHIDDRPEGETGRVGTTTRATTTTTTNQSRSGILTELGFDTVTKSDGTKVVEVNFIPFMRSRVINFKAQLLKPNTRFYPFFDGADITSFTRSETFSGSNKFEFSDLGSVDTHEGLTQHPDGAGTTLTSDSQGVLNGSFLIPRNDALKFATGTREFRLSDDSQNRRNIETSSAEAQYVASGTIDTLQETIISTKVPRLVHSELNEDRVLTETEVVETTVWEDPLAQTILIDRKGGLFVSSVEVFFRSKEPDGGLPVRLSIRTTKNGIPTQKIVPGADKVLYPDQVSIASDLSANNGVGNADTATKFSFDHPVYLNPDVEYAIVLTSMCDSYEVYVADMGGKDLTDTTKRISKQPYNGVFFTSQNASTWTPEQSKDLKFKLNRANFNISKKGEINLINDVVPVKKLKVDSIQTTENSSAFTVFAKNHGMYDTQNKVTISGVSAAVNGIPASEIGTSGTPVTHDIASFTHDSFTIANSGGTNATSTGLGGGNTATITQNFILDLVHPLIQNIQVPGTKIRAFIKPTRSKSVDGNELNNFSTDSAETEILLNNNFEFNTPRAVHSSINESTQSMQSFNLRLELESTDAGLTPIIDMNRASLFGIQNRVNSNSGSEEVASNGPNVAKYFTKVITLDEPADVADVFLNVKQPPLTTVELYFRALSGGSDVDINTVAFTKATPETTIPTGNVFKEVHFAEDPLGSGSSFAQIQFKIVMKSTRSSIVPEIKDFRAICST